MKHIILGICTLMLVTVASANDTNKPSKKTKATTEKKSACTDHKNCKDDKECKDAKQCAKACKPAVKKC